MTIHIEALPGPDDITRRELPNGLVVLVRENHHASSVVITGSLDAGSLLEPPELSGLASFTASMLLRGTDTRDFGTIYEMLEGNGASLSISGGRHTVGFSGKSLAAKAIAGVWGSSGNQVSTRPYPEQTRSGCCRSSS